MSNSFKFMQAYNDLPPEAQQTLVENHLSKLLDFLPPEKSKEGEDGGPSTSTRNQVMDFWFSPVLSAATNLQAQYRSIPKIDLKGKRHEINWLFDELARDSKISFIKERSRRDELLAEILHTLLEWLNVLWSVAYEHGANFQLVHTCLMFVAEGLTQLSESASMGGCKCAVVNLPVDIIIKDKKGHTVKRHTALGPQRVDEILFWIWRDLFVSLFAKGLKRDRDRVPEMLEDIQSVLGVENLEKLLYGGKRHYDDDDDDDEALNYSAFSDDECLNDYETEDDEDDDANTCNCRLHGSHWPARINRHRIELREEVEERLFASFEANPTLRLYHTLISLASDADETEERLECILDDIAGNSPETLVAALEIHISRYEADSIEFLLSDYLQLLRPRDTEVLQCALTILIDSDYDSAFDILRNELQDALDAIYAAVRTAFCYIEEPDNKTYLADLLKLKVGTPERKSRVTEWVDRVISDSNMTVNPVALAALMMGMPMIPGGEDGDEADILNFVNLDGNDPDLNDLREEFRPELKRRFDGLLGVARSTKKGQQMLLKLYQKNLEKMPWLGGSDTVTEMESVLKERSTKIHLHDALHTLISFGKAQRKKLNQPKPAAVRKVPPKSSNKTAGPSASTSTTAKTTATPSTSTPAANTSTPGASTSPRPVFGPPPPPPPQPAPAQPTPAPYGMPFPGFTFFSLNTPSNDDVDDGPPPLVSLESEDEGPPPLVPATNSSGGLEDVD